MLGSPGRPAPAMMAQEAQAVQVPRIRFTIGRLMLVVAITAVGLATLPRRREHAPTDYPAVICLYRTGPFITEGEVTGVDFRARRVVMSLGSDDGLVLGQTLTLRRAGPEGRCIGEVRVVSLDYDRSVGEVGGGWTALGAVAREGDLVSTR